MVKDNFMKTPGITRRRFLATSAVASTMAVLPRRILAGTKSPNEKLNIAGVGIGGMGANNLAACESENIVALCDVDTDYAAKTFAKYPKAKQYKDFRVMLEKQKDIDAVIVATPDHTHAVVALAAMQSGKHVYVQKPLTYSIAEARALTEAARKYNVMTQMGNQGHSGDGTRQICEWIRAGVIGNVREVHAWTNRPVWPQGIEVARPSDTPAVPATLDWDLWLGPAPYRPYHPDYLPIKWRAWWDFGTGSMGDLGCHILDAPFWALKLNSPTSVEACISTYWEGVWKKTEPKNEQYPRSSIVRYKFPPRGDMPEVTLTWWDGGMVPPRPEELGPNGRMGDGDGGVLFIGDKGKLMCNCYGLDPRLLPLSKMKEFKPPSPTIERVPNGLNGHEQDWVRSCKDGKRASSNFDFAGPLTETVLLGNLAVRFPNSQLLWDGANMKVTNDDEANAFVARRYRDGWTLADAKVSRS
jgi:predicted dehydrogenase